MIEDDFDFFNTDEIPEELKPINYIDLPELALEIAATEFKAKKIEILKAAVDIYLSVINEFETYLDESEATPQKWGMYNSFHSKPHGYGSEEELYQLGIRQTKAYYHLLDCINDLENGDDIFGVDVIVGVNYTSSANISNIEELGFESLFRSKNHLRHAIRVGTEPIKTNSEQYERIFHQNLEYTHPTERTRLKAWWHALKKSNYIKPEFLKLNIETISRLLNDYFVFEYPLSMSGRFLKGSGPERPDLEMAYQDIFSSKLF